MVVALRAACKAIMPTRRCHLKRLGSEEAIIGDHDPQPVDGGAHILGVGCVEYRDWRSAEKNIPILLGRERARPLPLASVMVCDRVEHGECRVENARKPVSVQHNVEREEVLSMRARSSSRRCDCGGKYNDTSD